MSSTALLLVATATGDLATLTSFAGTLPTTLIQSGYSRDFERAADFQAVDRLIAVGMPGDALADTLETLSGNIPEEGEASSFNYLSTHPANSERAAAIRDRAQAATGQLETDSTPTEETETKENPED